MRDWLHTQTFLKYLIAGGTGSAIHLALLYIFTDFFHIHYLISTTVALLIVFWVSFFMQKYWTFRESSRDKIWKQARHYFLMHSVNFVLNAALMFFLVSVVGVWYMVSQVIVLFTLAICTFFINKKFIFKKQEGV